MWSLAFISVIIWTVVSALGGGAVGSLALALAASFGAGVIGICLKWGERSLWIGITAGPALLLITLLSAAISDRMARRLQNRKRTKFFA